MEPRRADAIRSFYKPLGRGRLRGFQAGSGVSGAAPAAPGHAPGLVPGSGVSGANLVAPGQASEEVPGSGVGWMGGGGVDEQMGFLGRWRWEVSLPLSFPQSFWLKFFNCGGHAFLEHLDIGP